MLAINSKKNHHYIIGCLYPIILIYGLMGYEPTDHWIILDHWITKGSHMSSSCLVYHIVIFVKLSVIKNTCVRDHITYIIHIWHFIYWKPSTKSYGPIISSQRARLGSQAKDPNRCSVKLLEASPRVAARWQLLAAAASGGWSIFFSPVGPQIFEYIYIYMFRLCSVLSCIIMY